MTIRLNKLLAGRGTYAATAGNDTVCTPSENVALAGGGAAGTATLDLTREVDEAPGRGATTGGGAG